MITQERDNFYNLKWLDDFMIGHKGFIAGGCFKNIFNKQRVKDLDIFFESKSDYEAAVEYFDEQCGEDNEGGKYRFYYENDNVKAYKHVDSNITLELISKIYGSPEKVLSSFDFTISKFAYYKEEVTDGEEIVAFVDGIKMGRDITHIEYQVMHHENYFEHLHLNRLVVDDRIPYPASTFERMIRYVGYGYKPCRDTKVKIMQAINEVSAAEIAVPASLYEGID